MGKITSWAKAHKIAAIFAGAGALIVAGFVLIVALGVIFVSTGMVEPEPVAEETVAVETREPVKAETKAAPKTETPKTKKPSPEAKAEKPAPKTEKAEKKPTEKPEKKTAEPKGADYKAIQKDLSVFFDCSWENNTTEEDGIVRVDICPEEDVLLGTGSDVALNVWAGNVAEDVPTAYKVVGEGYTVITGTRGQANQAWDMLGAEGEVQPIK